MTDLGTINLLLRSYIPRSSLYRSQNSGILHRVVTLVLLSYDRKNSKYSLLKSLFFIALHKNSISTRYITVFILIYDNILELFSASSMFRPVYSFKYSKIPIKITCIIYKRLIIIFIKCFVYEFSQITTISKKSISFDRFFFT